MKHLKSIITTLTFSLLSLSAIVAQGTEFGVKAGFQMSDVSVNGLDLGLGLMDPQMTPGITAGLYSEMPLGKGLFFSPELNYTQKGFRVEEGINVNLWEVPIPVNAEAITKLHYLEAPLMMKYKFGNGKTNGYLKAGPTVGYAMSGTVITRVNSIVDFEVGRFPVDLQGNLYNDLEIGALVGAGFELNSGRGKFFMDVNFQHGFTDILNEPIIDLRVKNLAVGIGAGYAFKF